MNTEILQCLNMGGGNVNDMSILDLRRARMMWQKDQHGSFDFCCNSNDDQFGFDSAAAVRVTQAQQQLLGLVNQHNESGIHLVKPDPGVEIRWPEYDNFGLSKGGPFESCGSGYELNYAVSRTNSSGPLPEVEKVGACCDGKGNISCLTEKKLSSGVGGESFKKRKSDSDKLQNSKVAAAEEVAKSKKTKVCSENVESKIKQQNLGKTTTNTTETSADTSKEISKVTEAPKTDYIHVRARRGQATDSHSLAERVRREKISERMKYLQDLVPGCNKITGKAGMLDEIINYVQSLQRQVEFLSMKLAAVNPRLDCDIENLFEKEVFPACTTSYLTVGLSSDMTNPSYLPFNSEQQAVCGIEMGINEVDMVLRRTSSAPVSGPEAFIDTSCFNQVQQPSGWAADLHNLLSMEFHQGRSAFPSQTFTGLIEAGNLKMEM